MTGQATEAATLRIAQANADGDWKPAKEKSVNGSNAHPLFKWLTSEAPGLLGSKPIKWNFTKFLVGRDGRVIKRYGPRDEPKAIEADIQAALAA